MTGKRKAARWLPPVIGKMTPLQATVKLRELGYKEFAQRGTYPETGSFAKFNWPGSGQPKPWQHTAHVFGFISPQEKSSGSIEIIDAGQVKADKSLMNSKVKISLGRLRVYDYPGGGEHQILFGFWGQNQVDKQSEDVHFTQTYRVRQGQQAGIVGYPIFLGLNVGSEGVGFRCSTVNVKNTQDQKMLDFMEGDVFKKGLSLLSTVNPAVPVITGFAVGIAKAIASRNMNVAVQDFFMGLDFSNTPTGARLAEGSYVAMQVPDPSKWDWSEWVYNTRNGQVVPKSEPTGSVPYNYTVFSVNKQAA
jgi:hypothetical protein